MMSLLDDFSAYNQIKVKREDKYKTTVITYWGTFSYEHMHFGLSNAGVMLQGAMKMVFDGLINKIIHIYLDDLVMYSKVNEKVLLWDSTHADKGRHSKFQNVWLGPFKITFFFGANSYILKDLQE
jgi:hypothetical protein